MNQMPDVPLAYEAARMAAQVDGAEALFSTAIQTTALVLATMVLALVAIGRAKAGRP